MQKVLPLFILLAIVTLAFLGEPTAQTLGPELQGSNRLMEAYRQTGARFEEYTVTGWVQLNQAKPDAPGLKSAAWKAAEGLGAHREELVETLREDHGFRGVRLAGKLNPDTYVEIFVQTMDNQKSGQENNQESSKNDTQKEIQANRAETYMLITLYSRGELAKLIYHRNQVNAAFNSSGREAKTATVIKGSFPGKLTREAREKIHNQVFAYLGAKKSEGISTEELISWSGYSAQLPDRLELSDKVINLNVASRYSSTTDSTLLIMGTPIISVEY